MTDLGHGHGHGYGYGYGFGHLQNQTTNKKKIMSEWHGATKAYKEASFMMFAKDYVCHIGDLQSMLRECSQHQRQRKQERLPEHKYKDSQLYYSHHSLLQNGTYGDADADGGAVTIPMNMSVGDLARSGYNVFIQLALSCKKGEQVSSKVKEQQQEHKSSSPTSPLYWHAFRKITRAIIYNLLHLPGNHNKIILQLDNPVAPFLGIGNEWKVIQDLLQWHQVEWTILNQLKERDQIGAEIESVLLYERSCHAKLCPILEQLQFTMTLPRHCMDSTGNSIYRLPVVRQQRQLDGGLLLNFDPIIIVDMVDYDMTPRQRRQQLQAQLQLLQQEARILRQEMNGFVNELNELAENIRRLRQQHGAGHALDRHQQVANRLVHARNAIQIRYDQIHERLQQQFHPVPPHGDVNNIPNNNNNNNADEDDNNDDDHGDNDDDDDAVDRVVLVNADHAGAHIPHRPFLGPSPNPPSPETFIATGRCVSLRWKSCYKINFRHRAMLELQSLSQSSSSSTRQTLLRPTFTSDIFFPPQRQRHQPSETTANHTNVDVGFDSDMVVIDNAIDATKEATQVLPWEIRFDVTPTLTATFEVFRLLHPDEKK
jgi:hypothetical protein